MKLSVIGQCYDACFNLYTCLRQQVLSVCKEDGHRNTTPLSSEIKSEAVPDYYIFIIHMNTSHTARQV